MDAENQTMLNDAIVLVYVRNEFYRQKYLLTLAVGLLSIIVVAILAGMLYYLAKHPTEPLYFPADDLGRLIQEIPITQPNMSLDDVTAWTIEAVEDANSYDFLNYRSELQSAEKYFSDYGWRKYMQGLKASTNLVGLIDRKMIFIAKVVDQPKLIGQGILKTGAYGYKYQMPVLMTYIVPPYDAKSSFQNPLLVNVVVQRQDVLQSYKGLVVMQMNAAPYTKGAAPTPADMPQ